MTCRNPSCSLNGESQALQQIKSVSFTDDTIQSTDPVSFYHYARAYYYQLQGREDTTEPPTQLQYVELSEHEGSDAESDMSSDAAPVAPSRARERPAQKPAALTTFDDDDDEDDY